MGTQGKQKLKIPYLTSFYCGLTYMLLSLLLCVGKACFS